jgi:hypothetical protein
MASFYSLGPKEYLRRSEVDPPEIEEFTENLAAQGGKIERAMLAMEDHAYAAILNEISTRQLKEGFKPVTLIFAHGWRSPNVSVIAGSLEDFQNKPFEEVELPIYTPIFRLGALGDAVPVGKRIRDPFAECMQILAASGVVQEPAYRRFAESYAAEHIELHERRSKAINDVQAESMSKEKRAADLRTIEREYFKEFEGLADELSFAMDRKDAQLYQVSRVACLLNAFGPRSVMLSNSAESYCGKRLSDRDYRQLAKSSAKIRSRLVGETEELQSRVILDSLPRAGKNMRPVFRWIHGPFLDVMPPVELLAYWAESF